MKLYLNNVIVLVSKTKSLKWLDKYDNMVDDLEIVGISTIEISKSNRTTRISHHEMIKRMRSVFSNFLNDFIK